ncbi:hypothetical protein GXW82_15715 [Streptacidiphilus sp. 4-A2]|nr:hypothetical protein [Streptacidiphilus sp. 4-A2]
MLRHAAGSRALVELRRDGPSLLLRISNDGPLPAPTPTGSPGFGLVGIRERAESLGGSAQAGPLPEGGFRVTARLPMEEP